MLHSSEKGLKTHMRQTQGVTKTNESQSNVLIKLDQFSYFVHPHDDLSYPGNRFSQKMNLFWVVETFSISCEVTDLNFETWPKRISHDAMNYLQEKTILKSSTLEQTWEIYLTYKGAFYSTSASCFLGLLFDYRNWMKGKSSSFTAPTLISTGLTAYCNTLFQRKCTLHTS